MGDDATPQKWPTNEQALRIADTATELAVAIRRGMLTTAPDSPARLSVFVENPTGAMSAFNRLTRLFYAEPPGLREEFARFDTQPRPSPFDSMTPEFRERVLAIQPDYDRPNGLIAYCWPKGWDANAAQSLRILWNVYRELWTVLQPMILDRELVALWRIPHDETTVIEPVSLCEFDHGRLPSIDSWRRGSKWWYRERVEIENPQPLEQLDETMKRTDGGITVERLTALETFANQLRDALPEPIAPATTPPAALNAESSGAKKVTINAKMIDLLGRKPEAKDWSARQFAVALGCSKGSIGGAAAWIALMQTRESAKAARQTRSTFTDQRGKRRQSNGN